MANAARDAGLVERSERLAEALWDESRRLRAPAERRQAERIARLLEDPAGFAVILALTDEVLRIRQPRRAARHFRSIVRSAGTPRFMGPIDRAALGAAVALAGALAPIVMPMVTARVRRELAGFVIDAEPRRLRRHIQRRRDQGVRLNLNLLGEAILGDDEAERRLQRVLDLLERPDVDYVSVKVSSICAQLNPVAFDQEVDRIANQLRRLYDAALRHEPAKFVNLDMEEFRDLGLTVESFRRVLDEETYASLDAGIVLQAYIPESLPELAQLCTWARARRDSGGGLVKVRIVKGANLAMERVEAELTGWPQAPLDSKSRVDANYKRMLDLALDPSNRGALRVGVASHNVFELAWALTVSRDRKLDDMVDAEMLEGMAPSVALALRREAGGLLLYAPIAARADSESAIAYLVRRFDENTGPENFLRHQYALTPGDPVWEAERSRFEAAVAKRHARPEGARRTQDRGRPPEPRTTDAARGFVNEPDTDFSLVANRVWLSEELGSPRGSIPQVVAARVAGRWVEAPATGRGLDPGRPGEVAYTWVQATTDLVGEATAAARPAGERWRRLSHSERGVVVARVGDVLNQRRGRLIACMAVEGGKTVAEADPEVSEAVDFARYYAAGVARVQALEQDGATFSPLGTVVVVPPWNFPLAIPAGGVLAALAAGNAVILKPAPESVATSAALAEACWAAGVPPDVLQLVPCADGEASKRLITDPGVDGAILTGSWDTARIFLGWRPSLALRAETSGKNAMVITATADLDLAIADLVHSAFGHAGQKCSAASLAILEASVYDDPRFRRQLADAVRTLRLGPGWHPTTTMGPLIRRPEGPLDRALRHLDGGETWLVQPAQVGGNPQLWSPGVKLGVQPGSHFHLTECFGPVLGIMRAANLEEATRWQDQPAYGLTAGLHSLDPAEIEWWTDSVRAGNLYVNRPITGAIVGRQPFGGWKRSVVGPGAKAGGPNYLLSLGTWTAPAPPSVDGFADAVARTWSQSMGPSDPAGLRAEANVFRYRRLKRVLVRAGHDVGDRDLDAVVAAAKAIGVAVEVSATRAREAPGARVETDHELVERLAETAGLDKLRLLGTAGDELRLAAHDAGLWVDDTPFSAHPGLEALRWAREQVVSQTLHRHGDVTGRFSSPRGHTVAS